MKILKIVQTIVWGPGLLGMFLAVGVLCMLRLRWFPVCQINLWWKETIGSGGRGQFLTTCTALAATVGTGNITGVAAALAIGGPGAVFWMWAAAFLGMALAYAEVYLGILYRDCRLGGEGQTGPYVYLERGLGSRRAGNGYAFFCVMASLGMGSMVQAGAAAGSLRYANLSEPLETGILLTLLTAIVLFGGAGRIGRTAALLVPVSAGLYLAAGGIVVFSFWERIPEVLGMIAGGALGMNGTGMAAGGMNLSGFSGGMTGYGIAAAIRSGVSRGVFSNEAGLGSLAILHGIKEDREKEGQNREAGGERKQKAREQGMWAIFEVFFDTMVGCTLTALLLLCVFPESLSGTVRALGSSGAVAAALEVRFGRAGVLVTAACMCLFAFATIIAWFYIGEQALKWLLRGWPERAAWRVRIFYHGLYLTSVFLGCISRMEAVWELSDIWNGLMAIPNLAALVLLLGRVKPPEPV